jgi:gluconate 2-dehydrogenase gamma chain
MKRRELLRGVSLALATGPLPLRGGEDARAGSWRGQTFSRAQWALVETVQDHLLPSEPDAPGSRDVNATAYLDRTLADPKFDPDVKGFILEGIGWLEEIAEAEEQRPFAVIEPARREELLRGIAGSDAGQRWLSNLITYTLEALLADPLYGGNPGGIGWKWLGHEPGLPRPSPDKIYPRLGKA